jgi:hypothetical protein
MFSSSKSEIIFTILIEQYFFPVFAFSNSSFIFVINFSQAFSRLGYIFSICVLIFSSFISSDFFLNSINGLASGHIQIDLNKSRLSNNSCILLSSSVLFNSSIYIFNISGSSKSNKSLPDNSISDINFISSYLLFVFNNNFIISFLFILNLSIHPTPSMVFIQYLFNHHLLLDFEFINS